MEGGVDIDHDIVIKGNGHTIYGNGARILFISGNANKVEIHDLNFVNIYDYATANDEDTEAFTNGGAIYNAASHLTLVGCTFSYNCAKNGGAIFSSSNCEELVVALCNFTNNTAWYEGGAICSYGGLCVQGESGNNLYRYCLFMNCNAQYGGAISSNYESFIYYTVFANNTAEYSGGAIYNDLCNISHVINSYFALNKAKYGGALYNVIAVNCEFLNDYASSNGHDMNGGVEINCEDDGYSTNYYNTIHSTGFDFEPVSIVYKSGTSAETFEVWVYSDPYLEDVKGVNVHLVIDDDDEYYAVTDEYGIATFELPDLDYGFHDFAVNLVYIPFNEYTYTYSVQVGEFDSNVTFSNPIEFDYGKSGTTTATLDGCTISASNMSVVGHSEAKISLNKNVITVSGLNAGNYNLEVTTTPVSSLYRTVTANVPISVRKIDSTLTFGTGLLTFDYGKSGYTSLTITGGVAGTVNVVGHPEAIVSVNNNMITVSGLNAGRYTLSASVVPDANHKAVTKTVSIQVNKIDSTIYFTNNAITFNYGKSGSVSATLDGCAISSNSISVVGHPKALISVSNNVITVSGLAVGTYTLSVVTTPDGNHNSAMGSITITVNKAPTKIQASNLKTYKKSNKDLVVRLTDDYGTPIAGEKISVVVSNGKTASIKTDANGEATFKASKLSAGKFSVTLTVDSDKYSSSPVTVTVKVVKPTKLSYSVKKDSVKGGEALTIKVKANGKYKAGVKIKLLVYTKNKYKTIILKTKKVKKYCAALYATNAFSKGTHKVKILPYDEIKFTVSKNIKLKIKKKGKWTDHRSTIV